MQDVQKIQKYMTHSSEKYYQYLSNSEAVKTHLQIQQIANTLPKAWINTF